MPRKDKTDSVGFRIGAFALVALVSLLAAIEVFWVGWGSGALVLRFSLKWTVSLLGLWAAFTLLVVVAFIFFFVPKQLARIEALVLALRSRLGLWRRVLAAFAILLPSWFVFYSPWGALFSGLFFRLVLFGVCLLLGAIFLESSKKTLVAWPHLLVSGLLLGAVLVLAESFVMVTDFPFALHWSEGNRIWDYSLAFGSDIYNYAGPRPIFAWIDQGRQTLWGLPFLIPNVPIWAVRLWGALVVTLPYALLGWTAFWPIAGKARPQWFLAGLWAMLFLNQGPIYTPLVLAAVLVALARLKPIWVAAPLVYLAGWYAGISRFSWSFAAGIWAALLAFSDAVQQRAKLIWRDWLEAAVLGVAGIWTRGLPILIGVVMGLLPFLAGGGPPPTATSDPAAQSLETLQGLQAISTDQPFLWTRLFPNSIYPPGILLGLALATLPLIILLIYLVRKGYWKTIFWQAAVVVLGLGALLVVGVIASAKVGGGTDLHNMDMFLVGLVLVAGVAWHGFAPRLEEQLRRSAKVRWLLAASIFIPAFIPMIEGKPLELPAPERTDFVLSRIQSYAACARQFGEVLFMDQRQLITFGQMGDLPLVAEYEKKYVMDQALSSNQAYFDQFERDLASGRFSLIVTEREAVLYKDPELETIGDSLIEENNAWVTHVTIPLLTYYESVADYKDVAVELFMPIERSFDCP